MHSLLNMMHSQNNRAINTAISNRVIPEMLSTFGNLLLGKTETEAGTSSNKQSFDEKPNATLTKKAASRFAFNLRQPADLSPHTSIRENC